MCAACLTFATLGCSRLAPSSPTATPVPTVALAPLATETPEPPPSDTPAPPTPDFIGTAIAGSTAKAALATASSANPGAALPGAQSGAPTTGCDLPRTPGTWRLAPDAGAPADVLSGWAATNDHTATVEVVELQPDQHRYVLKSVDPATDVPLVLTYDGAPLPLAAGQRYRIRAWSDRPGDVPAGVGLRVDDDAGPVFLGVSLRETADAGARVLGGDRAGFTIEQLPTQCGYTELTRCGVELRAAPVGVGRGAGRVSLAAGKSADVPGTPAYRVSVLTSHFRRPLSDAACPDPADWVLSYRIERPAPNP